ncbi:MAG TPA: pitrilysin family protein [Pseudomonas sp.]|nr:pitrilysin family protein [Pseudomonas sp.]
MNEHNGWRYALIAVLLSLLLGLLAWMAKHPAEQTPELPEAVTTGTLQSLAELDDQEPARRALNIQTWRTTEGAKVLFVAAPELPMFDLRVTFAAGSSHDGQQLGVAMLTNAMLNEGIAGKDVTQIAEGFENLGAEFGNGAYRDMAVVSLRSLSAPEQRTPALALFSEVIGRPTFPEESLARIQNQLLAGFEQQKQNPGKLASLALFEHLYGSHPYAHASEGNAQSIPAIDSTALRAFHARAYSAGNAVIALVGDLSRSEAEAIAKQVSNALPQGPAIAKLVQAEPPKAARQHIEFPSAQTTLMLAQLGIDRQDPDYPALYLGNQILGGGGFGTRLMEEVREKRGLTYGVYSGFSPMQARGPFMINLQTRAELSEGTLQLVQDILRQYLAEGPTQQELDNAKRETAGSFPMSTASNADIVGQLGAIGFYDLPLTQLEDFMAQVQAQTVDSVKAALQKHLSAEDLLIVSAGPTVAQEALPAPSDNRSEPSFGVPEH